MAFGQSIAYACRAVTANLIDYYGANTAEMKTMGSSALVRALLSPQNTAGFTQISDGITTPIPGKLRAVAFAYDDPMCFDVCKVDGVTCNTVRGNALTNTKEIVFDFDNDAYRVCDGQGAPQQLQFSKEELAKYCTESDTSYITRKIAAFNRRFIDAFDKRMGEQLETMVGQNANNQAITRLPFFRESLNQQVINPDGFFWLDQNMKDIGVDGQYIIVGGKIINKINAWQKWAGLSNAGINLDAIDDINPYSYYDRNLDASLGINRFFQMSPGAVQLVTFNENIGENNREVTDLYTHSTFIDPITGLEVDFEWFYDPKCRKWTYEPYLYAQLAVARPGGCGIPNANGVLLVEDCSNGIEAPVCTESV